MEKNKLFAALLGVGLAVIMPWQSFAQGTPADAAAPAQVVTDGGVEAVRAVQESTPVEAADQDAAGVLEKIIESKGWIRGWDDEKKRFIAIGVAEIPFKVADPSKEANLQALRRTAAMHATLQAKAEIIQFLRQELSAEQQVLIPGTDLNKAMKEEIENIEKQLNKQKEILAELAEKKKLAEAAKLRGATLSDHLNKLMVEVIKKLDKEYTGKEKDQVLAARYTEAVKAYNAEYARYQDLLKKAKVKRRTVVQTFNNSVRSMAAMPLFGATAVLQTESWEKDGSYQVAVMVIWSNVLERAARAVASGEAYKIQSGSKKALTVQEWIRKQNLATMVGPRQYVDKDGVRWFLGVAATSVSKKLSPGIRNKNRNEARMFANQEAMLSVTGDYSVVEAAQNLVRVYDSGKDSEGNQQLSGAAVKSIEQHLTANIKKFPIRGGQVLATRTVRHPISGDTIYVVVYGYNPNHVASALEVWTRNYVTREEVARNKSREAGRQAAAAAGVRRASNVSKNFKEGKTEQNARRDQEVTGRQPKQKKSAGTGKSYNNTKPAASQVPTAGVYSGDTDVSLD